MIFPSKDQIKDFEELKFKIINSKNRFNSCRVNLREEVHRRKFTEVEFKNNEKKLPVYLWRLNSISKNCNPFDTIEYFKISQKSNGGLIVRVIDVDGDLKKSKQFKIDYSNQSSELFDVNQIDFFIWNNLLNEKQKLPKNSSNLSNYDWSIDFESNKNVDILMWSECQEPAQYICLEVISKTIQILSESKEFRNISLIVDIKKVIKIKEEEIIETILSENVEDFNYQEFYINLKNKWKNNDLIPYMNSNYQILISICSDNLLRKNTVNALFNFRWIYYLDKNKIKF